MEFENELMKFCFHCPSCKVCIDSIEAFLNRDDNKIYIIVEGATECQCGFGYGLSTAVEKNALESIFRKGRQLSMHKHEVCACSIPESIKYLFMRGRSFCLFPNNDRCVYFTERCMKSWNKKKK